VYDVFAERRGRECDWLVGWLGILEGKCVHSIAFMCLSHVLSCFAEIRHVMLSTMLLQCKTAIEVAHLAAFRHISLRQT
jgi:hypothetical protein